MQVMRTYNLFSVSGFLLHWTVRYVESWGDLNRYVSYLIQPFSSSLIPVGPSYVSLHAKYCNHFLMHKFNFYLCKLKWLYVLQMSQNILKCCKYQSQYNFQDKPDCTGVDDKKKCKVNKCDKCWKTAENLPKALEIKDLSPHSQNMT